VEIELQLGEILLEVEPPVTEKLRVVELLVAELQVAELLVLVTELPLEVTHHSVHRLLAPTDLHLEHMEHHPAHLEQKEEEDGTKLLKWLAELPEEAHQAVLETLLEERHLEPPEPLKPPIRQ